MWEEFFLKDWNLNILKDLFYVMDGTNTTQIMFGAAGLRWAGGLAGAWEGGVGLGVVRRLLDKGFIQKL